MTPRTVLGILWHARRIPDTGVTCNCLKAGAWGRNQNPSQADGLRVLHLFQLDAMEEDNFFSAFQFPYWQRPLPLCWEELAESVMKGLAGGPHAKVSSRPCFYSGWLVALMNTPASTGGNLTEHFHAFHHWYILNLTPHISPFYVTITKNPKLCVS